MSEASIDDLLGHEEEPPPRRPKRMATDAGWWIRTLLTAGGLAAVAVFGMRMAGLTLAIPLAFAGCLALLLLRRVVALVSAPPLVKAGLRRARDEESGMYNWAASQDALRLAVHRWEVPLGWSRREDAERYLRTVPKMLRELTDERLRQRHGLTIASDPKSARVLLGEELWTLLTTPVKRPLAPRELAASVSRLEKL
ncbi:hypothetical protein RB614_29710 [Phytohabitans sp. ZYX-F-186]|uniref:DUF4129 domain-containing protein n=1 Tax=Phytohabitans maris TaxID=3071409 RepID=A0ABU0ZQJ9_9ACTN|nr:hypothetical protein [Phytohabitans sp. ZYX-F-186]MDQ7908717.1 hypothetical protein [Phytohabitans sp. ZYX-F-186]